MARVISGALAGCSASRRGSALGLDASSQGTSRTAPPWLDASPSEPQAAHKHPAAIQTLLPLLRTRRSLVENPRIETETLLGFTESQLLYICRVGFFRLDNASSGCAAPS
jgi:hypothetical protein